MVCANCGVYEREERFDGHNHYTVCARCGRSELNMTSSHADYRGWRERIGKEHPELASGYLKVNRLGH